MQNSGISTLPDDERTAEQLSPKLGRLGYAVVFALFIWGLLTSLRRSGKRIGKNIPH
jgi:hypothetical protein